MPPKLAIMITGTLLVAAAAVGIFAIPITGGLDGAPKLLERSNASRETRDAPRPPQRPDASAAPRDASQPPPPRARAGRVYDLEEAIKRLDLIKPARQKMAEDFALPTPTATTFKLGEHRG